MEERKKSLAEFTAWAGMNIKGDEKGEAQIFLERLFQAFGQSGCLDVGGHPQFRIRKSKEDGGGVAFADYVWKPIVLIEMKRRGVDLAKHYRQAFEYWTRLVPGRPRYVVLCNFDDFWVYDFENQIDTPVDQVAMADLPDRYGPLAFLFPTEERPTFGNDHVAVTRQAADRLAVCFNKLTTRKVDRDLAQRFILQVLVALFAEDIGLMQQYTISRLLEDCKDPRDSYDLLGGLFVQMNTAEPAKGGRFKGVPYFNGGVFSQPARVELYPDEVNQLKEAAKADWSKVRPEIFGTLFEHSMDTEERHAFGGHFTNPVDILKIVEPTIARPWRERIESARTLKQLRDLLQRMQSLRILDPACGSGNFLYVAYRELKRLEARALERIAELSAVGDVTQRAFGFVRAEQFYGMDINGFAVELAKVTMMIARKLAIDELHVTEPALPLDNLDDNFVVGDALIDPDGKPATWPQADVIIGNPPFLGAKRLKPERGPDYVKAVRAAYPDVPGMADYCVYWFRKAHDLLPACTAADPFAGRAGLVGTQNVRNNQSRVGGLDHIVKTGTIIEAVDNQPWSGEANVHVSIVNWVKTQDAALLPSRRRLWSRIDTPRAKGRKRKRGAGSAAKQYELACRECDFINSSLSDLTDVSVAKPILAGDGLPVVCQGITPGHGAFVMTPVEREELVTRDPASADVIYPYLIGREIVTGSGRPNRFLIDLGQMSIIDAQSHTGAFARIEKLVLPDVQSKAAKEHKGESAHKSHLERWWLHWRGRPELIAAVSLLSRYIVCPRVTKRPIFAFVAGSIRPGDALQVFAFADDYSFGILQANPHWQWFVAKCSKLKSDFRYTPDSVFDTFPWPQSPTAAHVDAVAEAGREVRRIRSEALANMKGGLRALYRTLGLPGKNPLRAAHAALDAAVLDAFGFSAKEDLLKQLLELNLQVAKRISRKQAVTAPGVPPSYPNPTGLITEDCVQPWT